MAVGDNVTTTSSEPSLPQASVAITLKRVSPGETVSGRENSPFDKSNAPTAAPLRSRRALKIDSSVTKPERVMPEELRAPAEGEVMVTTGAFVSGRTVNVAGLLSADPTEFVTRTR